jgi:alpha-tubulin suppressor-like RCC1 family protein
VVHGCGVDATTDTVICWGPNGAYTLGSSDTSVTVAKVRIPGVIQVAAGHWTTCALTNDHRVSCWGDGSQGQLARQVDQGQSVPIAAQTVTDAVTIEAGRAYFCAVTTSSAVRCWGTLGTTLEKPHTLRNEDGSEVRDAQAVTIGYAHYCVLRKNGRIACAGRNARGQLGLGAAESDPNTDHPLRDVPGLTGIVDVAAGADTTCAVKGNGALYCWGRADLGQLGLGAGAGAVVSNEDSSRAVWSPVKLEGLPPAVEVEAGMLSMSTCARFRTGAVKCFGQNQYGEAGDGTKVQRLSPVDVKGLF